MAGEGLTVEALAALIDLAYAAVIVRDPAGGVLFLNRQAEHLYGWSREDVLGLDTHSTLETRWPVSAAAATEALEAQGRWQGELEQIRRDGSRIFVLSRQSILRGADGRPLQVLEVNLDITEAKRRDAELLALKADLERRVQERTAEAERRANELAAVFDAIVEPLVLYDAAGRPVQANPAAVAAFGFDPGLGPAPEGDSRVILAERLAMRQPEGQPVALDMLPVSRSLRGEVVTTGRYRFTDALGRERMIQASSAPIHVGGEVAGVVSAWSDITEREELLGQIQAQAESLRAANAQLKGQAAELARRAEAWQAQSEALDRAVSSVAAERALLGAVLEQMWGGVVIAEVPSGQVLLANRQVAEILRGSHVTVERPIEHLLQAGRRADGQPYSAGQDPFMRTIVRGEEIPGEEVRFARDDRSLAVVLVSSRLVRDGDGTAIAAVLTLVDITGRKGLEESLREARDDLERRVQQRTAELSETAGQLAAANTALRRQTGLLRIATRRLVEVQENERRGVARELHDESSQALTALAIGLGMLERSDNCPEEMRGRLAELKCTTQEVMGSLHRLAANLRPPALERAGLVATLRQYLASYQEQHGVDTQFAVVGLDEGPGAERLSSEVAITIYRVVQEALTNVLRHARASHVGVLLEASDGRVIVVVEDDGIGFDYDEASQRGRLGLFGMRERVEMLGGQLSVESAAGTGTTIYVELPLQG